MRIVSTEEFYEAMCRMDFVRISYLVGRTRGEQIMTLSPPEDDPEFMNNQINKVIDALKVKKPWWAFWL